MTRGTAPDLRRAWLPVALAVAAAVLAPSAALATPPATTPTVAPGVDFPAGSVCDDHIVFENLTVRGHDTTFAPSPAGTIRTLSRGSGTARLTDVETGQTYTFAGGVRIKVTVYPDGSVRADATGVDLITWYLPGDPAELGPGLFRIMGHVTEWYDASGALVRATHEGRAINVCDIFGA